MVDCNSAAKAAVEVVFSQKYGFAVWTTSFLITPLSLLLSGVAVPGSPPHARLSATIDWLSPPVRTLYAIALFAVNLFAVTILVAAPLVGGWWVLRGANNDGLGPWWLACSTTQLLLSVSWGSRVLDVSWRFLLSANEGGRQDSSVQEIQQKGADSVEPTPQQNDAILGLHGEFSKTPVREPVQAVLAGPWGVGKTLVLNQLQRKCRDPSAQGGQSPVLLPAYVNVWQVASLYRLEERYLAAATSDWQVYRRAAWWLMPCVISRAWSGLRRLRFSRASLWGNSVEFQSVPTTALPLRASRQFRLLGESLAAGGARLVLFLDEVDRCERTVAQASLSVLIRSVLGGPGIGAVVVRVDEQMQDKVTNPLREMLPDVADSVRALLYADYLSAGGRAAHEEIANAISNEIVREHERGAGKPTVKSEQSTSVRKEPIAGASPPWREVERTDSSKKETASGTTPSDNASYGMVIERVSKELDARVTEHFFRQPARVRRNLRRLMEERLSPGKVVGLEGLTSNDLAFLLRNNSSPGW